MNRCNRKLLISQLHYSLILSQLNYGATVYNSANKSVFALLDAVPASDSFLAPFAQARNVAYVRKSIIPSVHPQSDTNLQLHLFHLPIPNPNYNSIFSTLNPCFIASHKRICPQFEHTLNKLFISNPLKSINRGFIANSSKENALLLKFYFERSRILSS